MLLIRLGAYIALKAFGKLAKVDFCTCLEPPMATEMLLRGNLQIIVREIIIWTNNSYISQFPDILCSLGFRSVYIIQLLTAALSHCR